MLSPQELAVASAVIALAALFISGIALWRTHFATIPPIIAVGHLRHRIYPIRSGEERWYLTSFDLPLTASNYGARPILVTDLRLSLHYPELPIPNNRESIYADWDIDPASAQHINEHRFEWLDELTPRNWMPFAILPKETVLKHIIFETRWEDAVIQETIAVTLEYLSSISAEWDKVATWEIQLAADVWGELANKGTSISYAPPSETEERDAVFPEDLHKYTGSKEPIPENGFAINHDSRLDYPKK